MSAAYALAQVGGEESRAAIEAWKNNPELASRTEQIPWHVSSEGGSSYPSVFGELFDDALKRMKNADEGQE